MGFIAGMNDGRLVLVNDATHVETAMLLIGFCQGIAAQRVLLKHRFITMEPIPIQVESFPKSV